MAVKYTSGDKEVFLEILARYPIIESKKCDANTIEEKKEAWENIVADFNSAAYEQRTVIQLKRLWDKMKRNNRSMLADESSIEPVVTLVTASPTTGTSKRDKKRKHSPFDEITNARMQLIQREGEQLEELHQIRMEEAHFAREAARLRMLQEEAKLKKIIEQ